MEKILLSVNILFYSFLAIFSYAYVDLNLTLSKNVQVLQFVETMQQLGYFNRPTAATFYFLFIILAFSFFIYNLWLFYRVKVGLRYLQISTILNTLILIFAYPFLSSDLFNYLFDAKIILNYQASPYTNRPLDFPNDEWLRFMRWTHRYSPYGPLWLTMSLIPAALGFGKFILNLFTFKIFIATFHLINAYLIFKILRKTNPKLALFGTSFYSLNPLFLIEGVANAHNDVVLATSIIGSIYFLVYGKFFWSHLALVTGALIKYIPILNLPSLLWVTVFNKGHDPQKVILANLATMAVFTYLFSTFKISVPFVSTGATQVQFQPWYLFWTLPIIALIPKINFLMLAIVLAFGASLRYLPFIYYGDWSHSGTIVFMKAVTILPSIIIILAIFLKRYLLK